MLHDMRLVVKAGAGDAFKVERATGTQWKGSFEEIGVFALSHGPLHFYSDMETFIFQCGNHTI